MNEIYWLTRLDGISSFLGVTWFIAGCVSLAFIVFWILASSDEEEEAILLCKKTLKVSVPIFLISVIVHIFVPNTKEALMIWGVGGTIEYIKSNDNLQQLPDKCVDALDKFVNDYIEKE